MIRHVVDARELAVKAKDGPDAERVRAATAHTSQAPRPLGLPRRPARPTGRRLCGPARGEPALAAGQFASRSWWAPGSDGAHHAGQFLQGRLHPLTDRQSRFDHLALLGTGPGRQGVFSLQAG
ncbi:hypothetical protein KAURM247S_02347 [Kitasatospora aureofaciens]